MTDINKSFITGRVVRDSEFTRTQSGKIMTRFDVAVNDDYKKGENWEKRTHFFRVVYGGEKELVKGEFVSIEGKLMQVQSKKEEKTSYVMIFAQKVMVEPKKKEQAKQEESIFAQDYENLQQKRAGQKQVKQKEEIDEEIPF